jgi:hypothetical protein
MKEHLNTSKPVAILLAVLVGICGLCSYGVTKMLIDYHENSRGRAHAMSDPYYTEAYIKYHQGSLTLLGRNVSFARLLTTDRDDPDYEEAFAAATEELMVSARVHKNFESVSLLDRSGMVVASSEEHSVGLLRRSASVQAGAAGSECPLSVCMFVSDEDQSFAILVPVRVADEMVGIVFGRLAALGEY